MTDRERWTVYPLLFLTLGITLKDKLTKVVNVDEVRCKSVFCNAMVATDPKTKEQVSIVAGEVRCQDLRVIDPQKKREVRAVGGEIACLDIKTAAVVCKALQVLNDEGNEAAQIASTADGGFVRLVGAKNGVTTFLGNTDRLAALMFLDDQGRVRQLGAGYPLPLAGRQPPGNEEQEPQSDKPPAEAEPQ